MTRFRLIFVGMHNKPGKMPLCSSTFSGKLIDRIIKGSIEKAEKTNLYDVEYFPLDQQEKQTLAYNWIERVNPSPTDIVVLCGAEVHSNFPDVQCVKVKIPHPASNYGLDKMNAYVETSVNKILLKIAEYDLKTK